MQQVVGVAVLGDGPRGRRVLAARRVGPARLAGGWELPGGKCRDGEAVEHAAVREVREELGCRIRVTGRLMGEVPIAPGLVLRAVTAVLVEAEPTPLEHDALRWLHGDEFDAVPWLAPDVPFLQELRRLLEEGS